MYLITEENTEVFAFIEHKLRAESGIALKTFNSFDEDGNDFLAGIHCTAFAKALNKCRNFDMLDNCLHDFARKLDCREMSFIKCNEFSDFKEIFHNDDLTGTCLIPCVLENKLIGFLDVFSDQYDIPFLNFISVLVTGTVKSFQIYDSFRPTDKMSVSDNSAYNRKKIAFTDIPDNVLTYLDDGSAIEADSLSMLKQIGCSADIGLILIGQSRMTVVDDVLSLIADLRNMYRTSNITIMFFVDKISKTEYEVLSRNYKVLILSKCFLQNTVFKEHLRFISNTNKVPLHTTVSLNNIYRELRTNLSISISGELYAKYEVSPNSMNHYSVFYTGLRISQIQDMERIDHACSLMQMFIYDLKEVAQLSGFSSYAAFDRAFRQQMGCKPSDFYGNKNKHSLRK